MNEIVLSDTKLSMLFYHLLDPNSKIYKEQQKYEIQGNLDPELFEKSWETVVKQNEALHSVIEWREHTQLVQVFNSDKKAKFVYKDLSFYPNAAELSDNLNDSLWNQEDDYSKDLISIHMYKIAYNRFHFIICFHHILMDGWSNMLLLEQLMSNYMNMLSHKVINVRTDRYKEYLLWYSNHENDHIQYWRNKLRGFVPVDETKRQTDKEYYRAINECIIFELDGKPYMDLLSISKEIEITISTLFYSLWAIVYASWTGQYDFLMGVIVSGRNNTPMNVCDTIGLFIKTLPIRMCLKMDQSCTALFRNTADCVIDAQEYTHVQLSRLFLEYGIAQLPMIMVIQSYPDLSQIYTQSGFHIELKSSKYELSVPLAVSIRDHKAAEKMEIEFSYHPAIYRGNEVQEIWERFLYLLTNTKLLMNYSIDTIISIIKK